MAVLTASGGKVMPGPKRLYTDFRGRMVCSKRLGGAVTGTTGDVNRMIIGGHADVPAASFEWHVKGTQTIIAPVEVAAGLDLGMDQTANDGLEVCPTILYNADNPATFKVGTDGPFYVKVKLTLADVSGTDDCAIGFRKCEAYQAAIDDYDEMAALNVISGNITIETILNNAATTSTDTTDNWADAATKTLGVYVDADGAVTYTIDGVAPTTTAAFSFDVGEEVTPFVYYLHDTDICDTVVLNEFDCGLQ